MARFLCGVAPSGIAKLLNSTLALWASVPMIDLNALKCILSL